MRKLKRNSMRTNSIPTIVVRYWTTILTISIGDNTMITCAHTDCDYSVGWTHRGGENNTRIDPPEGDFYVMKAEFTDVTGVRFHDPNDTEVQLLGCPKCFRTFISTGDKYLDD
jgi:hypothetical protein